MRRQISGPPESVLESLSDAHEFSLRELRRAILRPPPWKIERETKNLSRLGTGSG